MADAPAEHAPTTPGKWGPREHLTSGWMGAGGVRTMAADGETLHLVVWDDGVQYLRSEDGGATWQPKRCLATASGAQAHPTIHRSGRRLHVLYQDGRDGDGEPYSWRICYIHSGDGGRTWQPAVRVSSADAMSFRHATAVAGDVIHEVWSDKRHNPDRSVFSTDGNWEIYYKRSADGGRTWGPDVRLTRSELVCQRPAIGVVGDVVLVAYIAWQERGLGALNAATTDVYTIRSADGGDTWGPSVRLTDTPHCQSMHPQVVAPGPGALGLFLETGRCYDFKEKEWTGRSTLLFRRSTDGALSWSEPRQISDGPDSTHSLVYCAGARVHVAWTDRVDDSPGAFYATSPDGGLTWTTPECLTPEGGWNAGSPGATDRHVVVTMQPAGRTEVYLRRRALPQPR